MITFSYFEHLERLKEIFDVNDSAETRYRKIIELGASLPLLPPEERLETHLVPGCQSLLYLKAFSEGDKLFFKAYSDALISKGLIALLIQVYSGLDPLTIIKQPPTFLKEWNLLQNLSPSRSNGVASAYLKMQQLAIRNIS